VRRKAVDACCKDLGFDHTSVYTRGDRRCSDRVLPGRMKILVEPVGPA